MTRSHTADFVIVGGGIIGLAIAKELRQRRPVGRIIVLDKEPTLGRHASGRNSGVLHSGVYYPAGSLKARICSHGARELAAFCEEHSLPIRRCGKVILPVEEDDDARLRLLYDRARSNGARADFIDAAQLREIEPEAHSRTRRALHVPETAVVDPLAVLQQLERSLRRNGVEILLGHRVERVDLSERSVTSCGVGIAFGHLFNAAGLYADRVARAFGVGERYSMLPFKGLYYRLAQESGLRINGLIYPVPDLEMPFLGVHFTTDVGGAVEVGPTALPALGRENYRGLQGLQLIEAARFLSRIAGQYVLNKQGFRRFAHKEGLRFFKPRLVAAARAMVPRLKAEELTRSEKVGIRAQLLDRETNDLVMDFLVEQGVRSTHILNAVSPAFTSAFSFARLVLDSAGVN